MYSEKSAKSETSNYGLRFLRFFSNAASKNVKSRVFWRKKTYSRTMRSADDHYTLIQLLRLHQGSAMSSPRAPSIRSAAAR